MSSSETQKTPKRNLSLTFKSEKPHIKPKLRVVDDDSLSTKTPEKPQHFRHKSLRESTQKQPTVQIDFARRKIESWPDENPNKTHVGASEKIPEKYEILGEFFDCLDASIRLLRLRGLMTSFSNICPKIKCLTDRRFTYSHLAQLKFIFPEAIEIKKVLVKNEKTNCLKPDLHVTLNVDAVENDELKSEGGGHMHLRRAFRERLADISKFHPEGYEIPKETLPQPFNCAKQDIHPDTIKFPLSLSPEVLTDLHTVEKPEASTTHLQGDEIPDETHQMPSNQSKEGVNSNISGTPGPLLPIETSFEAPIEQQPAMTAHLSRSFRRHFSKPSFQARNVSVPESNLSIVYSVEEASTAASSYGKVLATPTEEIGPIENDNGLSTKSTSIQSTPASTAASSYGQVPATPTKEIGLIENDNGLPTKSACIQSTPAKLASTPARLMTVTPALHPPKRCYMSPDDNSTSSPEKLVRRPPRSRSLKFDTPVKNKKVEDEALDMDGASFDNCFSDILPEDLLQSLEDEERKEIEDQNPDVSQAKRQRQMISSLPKLFNTIHLLFQSMNSSAITKEELVHKIIWINCDFVDRKEVEEQLTLLLKLVPEWISEKKLAPGGDLLLIYINKMSNPDSIRARLEEAI
ncbi:PREDICTED: CDT1 [Prunus dulcis]|nr:CDT1-like protein b [Prunus dulcis]VVA30627.1 PREDICTED: CDT1 [Prunus dulcis]